MTNEEREVWRALSVTQDRFASVGDALRQTCLAGLEQTHPEHAAQIRAIREGYALSKIEADTRSAGYVLNDKPVTKPAKEKKSIPFSEAAKRVVKQQRRQFKKP